MGIPIGCHTLISVSRVCQGDGVADTPDIGKLAVPNEILIKPGKLNESEYDIVKQHPNYSNNILQQVEGLEDIAIWVGCHHETLDGKGYPFGLRIRK